MPVLKCQLFTDRGNHRLPQCLKQFQCLASVSEDQACKGLLSYSGLHQLSQLDMQQLCNNNTHTEQLIHIYSQCYTGYYAPLHVQYSHTVHDWCPHWTFLVNVLPVLGLVYSSAFSTISATWKCFLLLRGRHSLMQTRSPSRHSSFSS